MFDPISAAASLLQALGSEPPLTAEPLPGGRNSRVWLVKTSRDSFLLKRYLQRESDLHSRQDQEWQFLTFLHRAGIQRAPLPVMRNGSLECSLMEYIVGTPLDFHAVGEHDVLEVLDFFLEIQRHKTAAGDLPLATEACFSLRGHLDLMSGRMQRLGTMPSATLAHSAAIEFARSTLLPLWKRIEEQVEVRGANLLDEVLREEDRCLSPSDFGFHNALRRSNGRLCFLDFEYAGWDDPAKMIIDFCNQPDLLLPRSLAEIFRSRVLAACRNAEELQLRLDLLEPLYQLKWACICLNCFLPGRSFPDSRPAYSAQAHLQRARLMAVRAAKTLDGTDRL